MAGLVPTRGCLPWGASVSLSLYIPPWDLLPTLPTPRSTMKAEHFPPEIKDAFPHRDPYLRPREGTSFAGGGGAGLGFNFSSSHVQTPRSILVTTALYHLTAKLSGIKQRRSFYSSQKTNIGQPFSPIKQLPVLGL